MSDSIFFHIDLDAFYASVEQLDNPSYKNKPVIVGSLPTDKRGVVSTCSYEARAFGVHAAMPIGKAYRLCPQGIFCRGRMKRYYEKSLEVMAIFLDYSPDVQQMSIDEAFLDMSGTEKLFGDPRQVALKIKKDVYEKTGLSVSIGIASNKYIAKIASGLSKPDGLYTVKKGDEENFMLALPLKKVWGIGEKTQERLKIAGFRTTKDIHAASRSLLESILGECTASFLYSAVRGEVLHKFNEKPKSHSLSTERTFPIDVYDTYLLETSLMDMCYENMFRMLKSNWRSKTVCIKIRYEDFTTVSIQDTSITNVNSADELFLRAKNLFKKKYIKGRAVRLLGCGFQNIEDASTPQQGELFQSSDIRQQKIEKAILDLQKKHPEATVKKARLMMKKNDKKYFSFFIILSMLLVFLLLPSKKIQAQESIPKPLEKEDAKTIYNYTIDDENVEFYGTGSWDASLMASFTMESKDGLITFKPNPIVFKQITDITAWVLLQNKWYFEASVADQFEKSTIAAGFYGQNIVKHIRIGNRYIDFPDFYGISTIGEGPGNSTTQAPGIMAEFSNKNWQSHALFRYDRVKKHKKSFLGMNVVSQSVLPTKDFAQGFRLILPSQESFAHIKEILVETTTPQAHDIIYKDTTSNISYRKLKQDEYLLFPLSSSIQLKKQTEGSILILTDTAGKTVLENALGNWNDTTTFLGGIQSLFNRSNEEDSYKKLSHWCQSNTPSSFFGTVTKINTGESFDSLYLKKVGYFSPFQDCSLYTTSQKITASDVTVQSEKTKTIIKDYSAEIDTVLDSLFVKEDFFNESFSAIHLYKKEYNSANDAEKRALKQFPLATIHPEIYTGGRISNETPNLELSISTTESVFEYSIGTNAIKGSIEVFRNGIRENYASYDSKRGTITLSPPPSDFDAISISWLEYSDTTENGTLTAALGYKLNLSKSWNFNASFHFFWPVTDKYTYSTLYQSMPGSGTLALECAYNSEELSFSNILSSSIRQSDTSSNMRLFSMDNKKTFSLYFASDALKEYTTLIPKINPRPADDFFSPDLTLPILEDDKKGIFESSTIKDENLGGYTINLSWSFPADKIGEANHAWAQKTMQFSSNAQSLASANTISLLLKDVPSEVELYAQLGIPLNTISEDESLNPTWQITGTQSASTIKDASIANGWKKYTIKLTDMDRAKIASVAKNYKKCGMRIIAVIKTEATNNKSIRLGPLTVERSSFSIKKKDSYDFVTTEEKNASLIDTNQKDEMISFNTGSTNYAQKFTWKTSDVTSGTPFDSFSAFKYTEKIPLSSYKELNFFCYIQESQTNGTSVDGNTISIIFDEVNETETKTAVLIKMLPEATALLKSSWTKCRFDMIEKKLYIGGVLAPPSSYETIVHIEDSAPSRLKITVQPSKNNGDPALSDGNTHTVEGSFAIDEIYLSKPLLNYGGKNTINFSWKHPKEILSIGSYPILSDTEVSFKAEGYLQNASPYTNDTIDAGVKSALFAKAAIPVLTLSSSVALQSNTKKAFSLSSTQYKVQTNKQNPINEIFNAQDNFSLVAGIQSSAATKKTAVSLSLIKCYIPLTINAQSVANVTPYAWNQDIKIYGSVPLSAPYKEAPSWLPIIDYSLYARQKNDTVDLFRQEIKQHITPSDYSKHWLKMWQLQVNSGHQTSKRAIDSFLKLSIPLPFFNMTPAIKLTAKNIGIKEAHSLVEEFEFSLPFSIKNNTFSINWIKTSALVSKDSLPKDYFEDIAQWKKNLIAKKRAHMVAPIADFFDTVLTKDLCEAAKTYNAEHISLTTRWDIAWKRSLFATPLDLALPSAAKLSLSRDIKASEIKNTDIYQIKIGLSQTAFNCFGNLGYTPLFKWYKQDEFIHSIHTTIRFSQGYRIFINANGQTSFYLKEDSILRFSGSALFDTTATTSLDTSASWIFTNKKSPIISLVNLIAGEKKDLLSPLVKRTEKIGFGFTNKNETTIFNPKTVQYSILLSHNSTISLTDIFHLYIELQAKMYIKNTLFSLENICIIGGKIQF